jgi:hypothetical protein
MGYAYVGTDGQRLVVWAFGTTEDLASDDLNRQNDPPADLALVEVSTRAERIVMSGEHRCDSADPLRVVDRHGQPAVNHRGDFSIERASRLIDASEDRRAERT